jgi:hypothetical protein
MRLAKSNGGLSVPPHIAAQQAKEVAAQFDNHHIVWCPQLGAYELPKGAECAWGKCPLPPHQPVLFTECLTCGNVHMVAMVLSPKGESPQPAEAPEPTEEMSMADIFKGGKTIASSCPEIWPGVRVYHIERADFEGQLGRPATKLTITARNADFVCCDQAEEGDETSGNSSTHEVVIDAESKEDLEARLAEFVRGIEDGDTGRPVYLGPVKAAEVAWQNREK